MNISKVIKLLREEKLPIHVFGGGVYSSVTIGFDTLQVQYKSNRDSAKLVHISLLVKDAEVPISFISRWRLKREVHRILNKKFVEGTYGL